MTERQEQAALFEWAALMECRYPQLGLLMAIPNGQMRYGQPKEPGLRRGAPDIFMAVPRRPYHGLFLELKHGKNKTTPDQDAWLTALNEQGYLAVVAYSADEASEIILEYLEDK